MNHRRFVLSFMALTLAAVLTLGGCKQSSTQQPATQTANNPQEYGQPAGNQGGSSLPGVETQAPTAQQPAPEGSAANAYPEQQAPAGAAPAPAVVDIPAGTRLPVRLNQELGSKMSESGESFSATVAEDVVVDGMTVIPRGARAEGKVVDAKARGHFKGAAVLALRLQQVSTSAGTYPVVTSTVERAVKGKGKRSAALIGGGGGLGAIIGGIAGGGKGAAIGAVAGAGAGTAGAGLTGNKQIVLPAGTVLTFRLERAVRLG